MPLISIHKKKQRMNDDSLKLSVILSLLEVKHKLYRYHTIEVILDSDNMISFIALPKVITCPVILEIYSPTNRYHKVFRENELIEYFHRNSS